MIELTRLNGHALFVNCDQIKWAEAAPDTMLTLMNGEKVVVRESCAEVVDRVLSYRVRLLRAVAEMTPFGLSPTPPGLSPVMSAGWNATPHGAPETESEDASIEGLQKAEKRAV
jgi:flagellar protein FlbD